MELRRLGLITLEKQLLTIPEWEELEQYAGFDPTHLHLVQPVAEAVRRALATSAIESTLTTKRVLARVELKQVEPRRPRERDGRGGVFD